MPSFIKTTLLLLCLSLFTASAQATVELSQAEKDWLAKNPVIKVTDHFHDLPYSNSTNLSQPTGILPDIWRRVSQVSGLKIQWVKRTTLENDLQLLQKKEIDIISGSQLIQDIEVASTHGLFEKELVIVSRKDAPKYSKLTKLKGKSVAVIKASSDIQAIRHKFPRSPLKVAANALDGLTQVHEKKLDALLIDRLSFDHYAHAYGFDQLQISAPLEIQSPIRYRTNTEATVLQSIIAKSLKQISSVERTAIKENWTITKPLVRDEAYSQKVTTIAAILILLALLWATRSHLRINKLKDQKNELAKLRKHHDIKEEERSILLGNLAHEVRMPMNSILGFAKHLREIENDETKSKQLDYIISSSQSLVSTVKNILQLAKVESGGVELEVSKASIKEVFHDLEVIFKDKTAKNGLSFKADWDEKIPHELMLDKNRLRQILISLCNNALRFTKEGGLEISAGYSIPEGNTNKIDLVLKVTDTGMGIPDEQKEHVFNSFSQGSESDSLNLKQSGGTGLDLAICKRFASLMGGHLYFETEMGKGTTFFLMLPGQELAHGHDEEQFHLIDEDKIQFKPAKILLADDTEANREVIKLFLADTGFEIIQANNGVEALKQAVEEKPDLILLDTKMPVMNGYETLQRLEKSDQKDIPVVALTASSLSAHNEIIERDCVGYLRQPMKKVELLNELRRHLPHEITDDQ